MDENLRKLCQLLSALPGIGQRSAMRIVLHLMKKDSSFAKDLSQSIVELKEKLGFCQECGSITQGKICDICLDPRRDRLRLCVVEEPGDVLVIERTKAFPGLYHVLMGALSPIDGIGPEELRIDALRLRLQNHPDMRELFLATNPTLEGDATADYICKLFEEENSLQITRIAHGIATGSALEFAEAGVLAHSIRSRLAIAEA